MATSVKDAGVVLGTQEPKAAGQGPSSSARGKPGWAQWLKHALGLDRAIAFTILARVAQILGSTGTVLLILRFLTPVEQGYYYTLLSLVSLQIVFELGLSFVILQMAAHESVHLKFHGDGRIEGDAMAHGRLASILRKTFRWYLLASVVLCGALLPLGRYFFSRHGHVGASVEWGGAWTFAVFATAFSFFVNPFFSFLEGCGQVWQVGRMRLGQALLGAVMSWGALLTHHGLYSPGMVNLGYAMGGLMFLYGRRSLCFGLLRLPPREYAVSWGDEIWPFQWKTAVSWISAYFSLTVLTPILFAYRGPEEAGKFGMSLSITGYLWSLMLVWVSTKATPFGQMIARGEFRQVKGFFFRTLRRALGLLVATAVLCELGVVGLHYSVQQFATRLVPPEIFAMLLATSVSIFAVQSMAVYLRSFKREPFIVQSVLVAASTMVLSMLTVRTWGSVAAALVFLFCTGILGLSLACVVFHRWTCGVACVME